MIKNFRDIDGNYNRLIDENEISEQLNRKKEFVETKIKMQSELLIPPELKARADDSWLKCKEIGE